LGLRATHGSNQPSLGLAPLQASASIRPAFNKNSVIRIN
jgi:hypothetical protein